jgi:hypothetical protein
MSFSQELRSLSEGSQDANAGECFAEAVRLHRELGRNEFALGRAGWTLRYGDRGEWRAVLRAAAAEVLREARRAASSFDAERLRMAARAYTQLAGSRFADAAGVMLKPGERATSSGRRVTRDQWLGERRLEHVAAEMRWTGEPYGRDGQRRRGERRGRRRRGSGRRIAAAA